jgi:hypothetical protein
MSPSRHNLTRRALLGAGAALPLAVVAPAAAEDSSPFGLSLSKPGPSSAAENEALRQAQRERTEESASLAARRRWERALAAYVAAVEARDGFCRERLRPATDAHRALRARWPLGHDVRGDPEARALLEPAFAAIGPLEDEADDLECARLAALRRLLRTAAPHLPAFALKIGLAVDNEAWELTGANSFLDALKADARRLCHA